LFNPDNTKNIHIETVEIPHQGTVLNLKEYDFIKIFRIVSETKQHNTGLQMFWILMNSKERISATCLGKLKNIIEE
jgi:hypothetical protein